MHASEHKTDSASGAFPTTRLRRLRQQPAVRALVEHTRLTANSLILPLFVRHGREQRVPIASMPGHSQLSVDQLAAEARQAASLGLGGVILFGIPADKDATGSDATSDHGIVAAGRASDQAGGARAVGDHRRLLLRIHRSRPLRRSQQPAVGRTDVDNDATLELLGPAGRESMPRPGPIWWPPAA